MISLQVQQHWILHATVRLPERVALDSQHAPWFYPAMPEMKRTLRSTLPADSCPGRSLLRSPRKMQHRYATEWNGLCEENFGHFSQGARREPIQQPIFYVSKSAQGRIPGVF